MRERRDDEGYEMRERGGRETNRSEVAEGVAGGAEETVTREVTGTTTAETEVGGAGALSGQVAHCPALETLSRLSHLQRRPHRLSLALSLSLRLVLGLVLGLVRGLSWCSRSEILEVSYHMMVMKKKMMKEKMEDDVG